MTGYFHTLVEAIPGGAGGWKQGEGNEMTMLSSLWKTVCHRAQQISRFQSLCSEMTGDLHAGVWHRCCHIKDVTCQDDETHRSNCPTVMS